MFISEGKYFHTNSANSFLINITRVAYRGQLIAGVTGIVLDNSACSIISPVNKKIKIMVLVNNFLNILFYVFTLNYLFNYIYVLMYDGCHDN